MCQAKNDSHDFIQRSQAFFHQNSVSFSKLLHICGCYTVQVCVEPAKSLLYRINSRQADIMSDPVISVIKVGGTGGA